VCPISRRSYRYGILYPHNIYNIVYRTYMLTYFRLIIIMMWVGVGIWVRFQIGCCPAAATQVRPNNLFFFPILLPLPKVLHDAAFQVKQVGTYVKGYYNILDFTIHFSERGRGLFYRFTPTTDLAILSTLTLHSTRTNRCHQYCTYFIAKRVIKLSNVY